MDDATRGLDWRDLAEAIPGRVGVQVGTEFAYVSKGFAAAVGADAASLVGESWQLPFAPREAERFERDAIPVARSGGEWRGTIRAPGETGRLELTLSGTEGDAILWTIETRPTHGGSGAREGRLQERPEFARTLLDAIDDVFYVIDAEGEFHLWNDALAETTGYDHDEIAEMDPMEFVPEDQHEYVPGLREAIEATEDRRVDVDILTRSGERITHEFQGTTFVDPETGEQFRCGLARDVTDTRRLQRELEEEHRFVQNVVDAIEDVLYVVDEDGEFAFWNEQLPERFGYDHEEVPDLDPGAFLRPTERDELPVDAENIVDVPDRYNVVDLVTRDGQAIPHELYGRTYTDEETGERYRVGIARDVTERLEREEELRRQRTLIEGILNTIPDVVFAFDEAGDPIVEEAMLEEFAGYTDEELADLGPFGVIPEEDRAAVMERVGDVLENGETVSYETDIVTKDGTRVPHEFRAAPLELDGEVLGVVGSARDVSVRLERERELERQRDELATLDRMNRLLFETTREVIQSANREAVERAVCERLADSDLYQFAWVGERELDGDRVVPRVSAGESDGYLDAVTITTGAGETGDGPAGRALRTGEVSVMNVEDGEFEPWREEASERGFESVAAVPLRHDETVYGVLVVYATRADAFTPRQQEGFEVLGRAVGSVIHAAKSRELLFADTIVELEFRVDRADSVIVDAAADLACDLSLEGYVASDDGWVIYLDVEGASPEDVVETVGDDPRVERARTIDGTEMGGRVELVVTESSLLHVAIAAGATVRGVSAHPDGAELVVEAPADADVREVVKHVRERYPDADLVANRERDGEITTVGRPGGLLDELTDRQREVLEAAYRSGYFAWPRESTAEEVATSLGLAAPTLHGHIRKAEQVLLSNVLDDGSD